MKQLDLSFIINELGDDKDTIIEVLDIFKEMADGYLLKMDQTLLKENYNDISYEAHKMITPFLMLGLEELRMLALTIEKLAKEETGLQEIKSHHQKIKNLIMEMYKEMEELIPSL